MKKQPETSWLQTTTLRLTRLHFVFLFIYAANVIVSDASNLIAPEAILQRWTIGVVALTITTAVWYASRTSISNASYYRTLIFALILLDIAVATFTVYTQRGMASRGVALYALPILVSGALLSRTAILATTSLSMATYVMATVRYFIVHPGEGYKVELYGEVGFYSAVFFVLAGLLWIVIGSYKRE